MKKTEKKRNSYYEQVPESLEAKFEEFDKSYHPFWALKEKMVAVMESHDKKYITNYVRCDLIINLVRDYIKAYEE